MKVISIKNIQPSFGRALTTQQRLASQPDIKQAFEILGCKEITTIIPDGSFPALNENFLGQGHINSSETSAFLDFWKFYTGSNNIKIMPNGEIYKKKLKNSEIFYCPYHSSTLTLGTNTINLNNLVKNEYGKILSEEALLGVKKNALYRGKESIINFENVCGNNSPQGKALREAYENFKSSNSFEVLNLKLEFENFKKENAPFVHKRALYETLCDVYNSDNIENWNNETDINLFDINLVDDATRNKRIVQIEKDYADKIDFVYFKQFLAERELQQGRELLNSKGIKLTGDCQIGFSPDERWGFKSAFSGATVGWQMEGIDYSQLKDKDSEAYRLLDLKFKACAKRYDQLRVDCGWMYLRPKLETADKNIKRILWQKGYISDGIIDGKTGKETFRLYDCGDSIIEIIENAFKEVKKDKYNQKDIMYELAAGTNDFDAWLPNGIVPQLKNRKVVVSTMYMRQGHICKDFFARMNFPKSDYVLMTGNHDHVALEAFANGVDTNGLLKANDDYIAEMLIAQRKVLANDLHLDEKLLEKPSEFVKAKFAYNLFAENIKMFFMDILGRSEQYNSPGRNTSMDFRYMIPADYEKNFHLSLQNGKGLNIFDAITKAFLAQGYDKKYPKLFKRLVKNAKILYEEGALTEQEANAAKSFGKFSKIFTVIVSAGIFAGAIYTGIKNNSKEKYRRKLINA